MRERFERGGYAPVKVGDEIEVTIEAVGAKGDGLAKKDGFVLFVPNTKQGDKVMVKITRVLRNMGFAEVVETSERSEEPEAIEKSEEPETLEGSEDIDASEDTEDFGEDTEQ